MDKRSLYKFKTLNKGLQSGFLGPIKNLSHGFVWVIGIFNLKCSVFIYVLFKVEKYLL